MTIYEMLGSIRKQKGLTMQNMADELECSVNNIWKFEHGQNNNADILLYYLKRFGVDIYNELK